MGYADPKRRSTKKSKMLQVYPNLPGDDTGAKTAMLIFKNWKPHIFVTLYDIFMGAYNVPDPTNPTGFKPIHPFWIPHIMVDHDPIPESTLVYAMSAYKIAVPTHFGVNEFKKRGVDTEYAPFGIDTDLFSPTAEKEKLKEWLNRRSVTFDLQEKTDITEDSFLIFMNGANKDPYRKAFNRMFTAVQIFLEQNPDAWRDTRVYVHSWMKMARDIPHGAKMLKIHQICRGTHDYHNLCGVPSDKLADIYRASDVFMHLTQGGGFEIPVLEAISCGVPVIGSDFVGLPELIKDCGWLIPQKTKYWSSLDSLQFIADEFKAAEALEDAYNNPDKVAKLGKAGRERALDYAWDKVNPIWHRIFDEVIEEVGYKKLSERKL